jgi:hypothetical protein
LVFKETQTNQIDVLFAMKLISFKLKVGFST